MKLALPFLLLIIPGAVAAPGIEVKTTVEMGAPCTTETDFYEHTCNMPTMKWEPRKRKWFALRIN